MATLDMPLNYANCALVSKQNKCIASNFEVIKGPYNWNHNEYENVRGEASSFSITDDFYLGLVLSPCISILGPV